jgi:hypothetical protein
MQKLININLLNENEKLTKNQIQYQYRETLKQNRGEFLLPVTCRVFPEAGASGHEKFPYKSDRFLQIFFSPGAARRTSRVALTSQRPCLRALDGLYHGAVKFLGRPSSHRENLIARRLLHQKR